MRHELAVSERVGGGVLVAAFCAMVIVASITYAGPAWGQDDAGPLAGKPAIGKNLDSPSSPPNLIVITADDCRVADDASILLEDDEGDTPARFTNGQREITITADDNQIRIEGPEDDYIGDHATYPTSDRAFSTRGNYRVVSSEGITCRRVGNASDEAPDDQSGNGASGDQYDVVSDTVPNRPLPNTGGASPALVIAGCVLVLMGIPLLVTTWRGRD